MQEYKIYVGRDFSINILKLSSIFWRWNIRIESTAWSQIVQHVMN